MRHITKSNTYRVVGAACNLINVRLGDWFERAVPVAINEQRNTSRPRLTVVFNLVALTDVFTIAVMTWNTPETTDKCYSKVETFYSVLPRAYQLIRSILCVLLVMLEMWNRVHVCVGIHFA